ncbi:MAG: hypothetical protein KVP17_002001 [Porospora cf. gigantea B]|uniref:uncharacterized protein n=1 Tax=Porospora cf. gigantea B TaxID=2853592 RepID=UPI003571F9C8|nr:MAG: hypothetical protein KVP17_002001 [Porospora cf. gigantea B]
MSTPGPSSGFSSEPGPISGALPSNTSGRKGGLPSDVTKILYVRNLPYKITSEELYDIFGKFGTVQQIRKGAAADTKGTAFVVFDDAFDAKSAVDNLSGFNVAGRYLIVLYYNPERVREKKEKQRQKDELDALRKRTGPV